MAWAGRAGEEEAGWGGGRRAERKESGGSQSPDPAHRQAPKELLSDIINDTVQIKQKGKLGSKAGYAAKNPDGCLPGPSERTAAAPAISPARMLARSLSLTHTRSLALKQGRYFLIGASNLGQASPPRSH